MADNRVNIQGSTASWYPPVKRVCDFAVSVVALLLLLPLLAIIALAVRAESPGSPLFTQRRVGKGGRLFTLFKFRSMVKDAPSLGPTFTVQHDPRITRIGQFLRATSLDELPQLWNVLIGDMSLIGPRPALSSQESLYQPGDWVVRNQVRPGITGLAQVSGRSAMSFEDQLHCDLTYVANLTWHVDMNILLRTARVVLSRQGTN